MKMSFALLFLLSFMKYASCDDTTTAYSYSVPVDESAVQSVLSTMTDTALKQLFSQFQAARGTSAALSLASVYGTEILEGSSIDLNSLALAIATISGTQNRNGGTSIITDSNPITTSSPLLVTDNSTSQTASDASTYSGFTSIFTTSNASSTANSTSTEKAAAHRLFAASPLAVGAVIFALL